MESLPNNADFCVRDYDEAGISLVLLERMWHRLEKRVVLLRQNVCCPLFSLRPLKANNPTEAAALEDPDCGRQRRGSQDDPNHRAAPGV